MAANGSVLNKLKSVLTRRPQRLWQHARGTALFFITRALSRFVFRDERYQIGKNVRLQNIASLLSADSESRIVLHPNSVIYEHARLEAYGKGLVEIGEGSILGDVLIYSRSAVRIGPRCLTSWNVMVQDFTPHPISQSERAAHMEAMTNRFYPRWDGASVQPSLTNREENYDAKPITIGADVWLGANSTILRGTIIGDGSIVAAGSVVTGGNFPARSLIAGNPARVVKELPE